MPAVTGSSPQLDQVIYKGVAGNFLETLPMEAEDRVALQRANAVVSSPLTGRSIAVLLGLSGPVFIIGGIIWGLWSAAHIEAPKPDTRWLGSSRRPGIGFCSEVSSKSCQLQIRSDVPGGVEPTS